MKTGISVPLTLVLSLLLMLALLPGGVMSTGTQWPELLAPPVSEAEKPWVFDSEGAASERETQTGTHVANGMGGLVGVADRSGKLFIPMYATSAYLPVVLKNFSPISSAALPYRAGYFRR